MRVLLRHVVYLVAIAGISGLLADRADAQGVTSAALRGRLTGEGRRTIESANLILINTSTGARQSTTSNTTGRYNFENVPPGGPYTLEVRSIGFQQASKTGIMLVLGQRYTQDFELKEQVVTLQELVVVAATSPLINSGRTGAAQTMGGFMDSSEA